MQIQLNNNTFKKLFLEQISKISDAATIKVNKDSLDCITCTSDNSIVLSVSLPVTISDEVTVKTLNVGDIKKLIRALDCIAEENINIKLSNNNIVYSDKNIQFKYHLLEDGIITVPKINLQKLESLEFDSSFTVMDRSLSDMVRGSTFSTDSNKVYLTSQGNVLKGNLTDKTRYNIDNFELMVANDFKGTSIENMCLNFEIFRILSTCKVSSLDCKISSKLGVVLFDFRNNIIKTKYIISALTK
jgi:hypothetical protein